MHRTSSLLFVVVMTLSSTWMAPLRPVEGVRALMMAPFGTKSHTLVLHSLVRDMVARGHQVVSVSLFEITDPFLKGNPNFTSIVLEPVNRKMEDIMASKAHPVGSIWNKYPVWWPSFITGILEGCELFHEQPAIQQLWKDGSNGNHKFDVVVVDALVQECTLPLAGIFGVPLVLFSGNILETHTAWTLGVPTPFSYVRFFIAELPTRMSFLERSYNAYCHLTFVAIHRWYVYPWVDQIVSRFAEQAPKLQSCMDVVSNVSLVLVADDSIVTVPRPMLPIVQDIGCIMCRPAKPLPKELQTIIDEVDDGFILFSMGTWAEPNQMNPDMLKAIVGALSRLPQMILWKSGYNQTLAPNIKFLKWLPQQDLLGHPKIRAFVTHCGLHGLHEAAYHGVPVVGFPVFGDQHANHHRVVDLGLSYPIIDTVTEEEVFLALSEVINNPKYKAVANHLSNLFREQQRTPVDRAIYWIEYVIRHKGAVHLRSVSAELNLLQYYMVDVLAALAAVLGVSAWIAIRVLRCLRLCLVGGKSPKVKSN